jgi:hypothetical protein
MHMSVIINGERDATALAKDSSEEKITAKQNGKHRGTI